MANDDSSLLKEVDIDELDVRIFMLVKNTSSMQSSVSFLTRRGWETVCQSKISQAIDTIVKSRPDVVMVSVNHPNPNVLRLPQLLSQSMNALTIGFAESPDAMSTNRLNKSKFQYKFSGYPSGPSFHRYIRQILDRVHNPQKYEDKQNKKRRSMIKKGESDSIEVKGGSGDSENMTFSNDKKSNMINVKGGNSGPENKGSNKKEPIIQSGPERLSSKKKDEDLSPEERARMEEEFLKEQDGKKKKMDATERDKGGLDTAGTDAKKGTAYMPDHSEKDGPGGPSAGKSPKTGAARGASGFDDVDEQGFKRKQRPQRKMYPWQKADEPAQDPIKDHDSRPGASFEMKQSRKDLAKGEEEKEKQDFSEDKPGSGIQKGGNPGEDGSLSQSGPKGKDVNLSQSGPDGKMAGEFSDDPAKDKQAAQDQDGDSGFKKKSGEGGLDADGKSKEQEAGAGGDLGSKENKETEAAEAAAKDKSSPDRGARDNKGKPKPGEAIPDEVPFKELPESEDKFKRLMKEALKQATEEADPNIRIDIEEVEKVGVIPLNSQVLSGYVVVSRSGIGFDLGTDLLDTLVQTIETILPAHGIDVHCQRPFIMETEKFTFEFWKKNVGLFTVFEQSQREEIALTFLNTDVAVPEMKVSEHDPDMVKIEVANIDSAVPVNFKTYIYLERNKRFYKYLNDGRKILERQKNKLGKNKKTRELHIARSDFQAFQQYYAKNIIQSLLDALSGDIETVKKKSA